MVFRALSKKLLWIWKNVWIFQWDYDTLKYREILWKQCVGQRGEENESEEERPAGGAAGAAASDGLR